jgi:hypothetical protein
MISFEIETLNPIIPKDYDNFIDEIIVSFVNLDKEVNTACAVMRDFSTVQTLYTTSGVEKQVRISPKDPDTKEGGDLRIDDVAHIFFMHSPDGSKCTNLTFDQ